ncbi:MAG: hypothetical protein QM725_07045 [Lacibacter sp.]
MQRAEEGNNDIYSSEVALAKKIILAKGEVFVEQKFYKITQTIIRITNKEVSSRDLYAKLFPNLTPTRKGTESVFTNALENKKFTPLFHTSEYLYREWLINFYNSELIYSADLTLKINTQISKKVLEEFNSWVIDFPAIKGAFIKSNIKWDLGILPLNIPIKYEPKNHAVKKDLLLQLEKNKKLQIVTIDDIRNKIEISLKDSEIILERKERYPISPEILQLWLRKFGITVSLVTTTHLIEFGMPYGGDIINLDEILRFTSNGYGIIGLLASQLALLIKMDENSSPIEISYHPLMQSVVLGLARLEYFLNPQIVIF